MDDRDIEVTILLRNNKIKAARKRLGLSQKKFAEMLGVTAHSAGNAERFCMRYVTQETQKKIADFLGMEIEEVFPSWLKEMKANKITKEVDFKDFPLLHNQVDEIYGQLPPNPEEALLLKERKEKVDAAVKEVAETNPRNMRMLLQRIDGKTFDQIGDHEGITRERVRQITEKGKRLLSHRSHDLEDELKDHDA